VPVTLITAKGMVARHICLFSGDKRTSDLFLLSFPLGENSSSFAEKAVLLRFVQTLSNLRCSSQNFFYQAEVNNHTRLIFRSFVATYRA